MLEEAVALEDEFEKGGNGELDAASASEPSVALAAGEEEPEVGSDESSSSLSESDVVGDGEKLEAVFTETAVDPVESAVVAALVVVTVASVVGELGAVYAELEEESCRGGNRRRRVDWLHGRRRARTYLGIGARAAGAFLVQRNRS